MSKYPLVLGCTKAAHKRIGIDAVVNARAGEQWRNSDTIEETEMKRDARKVRDRIEHRVCFYQLNSEFFRAHQHRFAHLISDPHERY
jgi:hypothetical protein